MFRHGELCTCGDSFSSTSFLLWSCAITLPSGSAWPDVSGVQAMLSCLEEIVDDNVLTLAGLSSDPLKDKHLTTKSGRRRKLCDDYKKALTSELAAKRMKTGNQLARIDGADAKRLRETLSKEMLAYQCAGFRTFHDLRGGVSSCTEDGTRMEEPAKEKIAYLATHVGTNIAMALPIQVCGSQHTGSQTVVQTFSPHIIFLSRMRPSSKFSRCNSTFVSNFALQILIFPNMQRASCWNYRAIF